MITEHEEQAEGVGTLERGASIEHTRNELQREAIKIEPQMQTAGKRKFQTRMRFQTFIYKY